MGLAVLPSRLKQELFDLADVLVARTPVSEYPKRCRSTRSGRRTFWPVTRS